MSLQVQAHVQRPARYTPQETVKVRIITWLLFQRCFLPIIFLFRDFGCVLLKTKEKGKEEDEENLLQGYLFLQIHYIPSSGKHLFEFSAWKKYLSFKNLCFCIFFRWNSLRVSDNNMPARRNLSFLFFLFFIKTFDRSLARPLFAFFGNSRNSGLKAHRALSLICRQGESRRGEPRPDDEGGINREEQIFKDENLREYPT